MVGGVETSGAGEAGPGEMVSALIFCFLVLPLRWFIKYRKSLNEGHINRPMLYYHKRRARRSRVETTLLISLQRPPKVIPSVAIGSRNLIHHNTSFSDRESI